MNSEEPIRPDDWCPRPGFAPLGSNAPLAPPIYPSAVYRVADPATADAQLGQPGQGYVYARDGQPNADWLAEKCRVLHAADAAVLCGSGMAALGLVLLAQLKQGDHVIASQDLYGRSLVLLRQELPRLGVDISVIDTTNAEDVKTHLRAETKLVVVETISNPLLRVADLPMLAQLTHRVGAKLVVDNTFAGPTVCRPLEQGANLVVESLTKIINGHSDVTLGLVAALGSSADRLAATASTWGFTPGAFDCWLATRGLATLAVRAERASANAQAVSDYLSQQSEVVAVHYPGLTRHMDYEIAQRVLSNPPGTMISFQLQRMTERRWGTAERFIQAVADEIPFCPSLGDLSTTLSHPASTSHRGLTPQERTRLGISDELIRLSVGIESAESIQATLSRGLEAIRAME